MPTTVVTSKLLPLLSSSMVGIILRTGSTTERVILVVTRGCMTRREGVVVVVTAAIREGEDIPATGTTSESTSSRAAVTKTTGTRRTGSTLRSGTGIN